MINIKFDNKKFKIYASRRVECLEACDDIVISQLKNMVEMIMLTYSDPSDGFAVSFLANCLKKYDIEVISYRDYEKEKAPDDVIY